MNVLIIVWTITSGSVRMTLMMPPITNINKAEIFSQLQTIVLITATNHRRIFYIFFSSIKPYFASKKKIFSNAGAGHPSPYAMLNLDRCFTSTSTGCTDLGNIGCWVNFYFPCRIAVDKKSAAAPHTIWILHWRWITVTSSSAAPLALSPSCKHVIIIVCVLTLINCTELSIERNCYTVIPASYPASQSIVRQYYKSLLFVEKIKDL